MAEEFIEKVSAPFAEGFGDFKIRQGVTESKQTIYAWWDAVPLCTKSDCPASEECPYEQVGKCNQQRDIIKTFGVFIFDYFENDLDEYKLYRIGVELVPLYMDLIRFYIEKQGIKEVVTMDGHGRQQTNPLFKLINEQRREIGRLWKELGMKGSCPMPGGTGGKPKNPRHGVPGYYDEMAGITKVKE